MNRIVRALFATSAFTLLLPSIILAQTPGTNPALKIVTPSQNQTIYGNRIPILLSAENFQIVDYQQYPRPQAGQGHVHLWLDDPNPTRESAVKLTSDSFTYTDVNFGQHTLRAELVANNHTSLAPPQVITVNFANVPLTSPSPAAASGFDKNTALVILVVVALVIVAAWWYTKEEEEEPQAKSKVESLSRAKSRGRKPKRKASGRRRR